MARTVTLPTLAHSSSNCWWYFLANLMNSHLPTSSPNLSHFWLTRGLILTIRITYHPTNCLSELGILLKSLGIGQLVHGPCRGPKQMTKIIVETIHCMIGSVKNDVACSSGDGGPNNHPQRHRLVSETDQRSAGIQWHAASQPLLIACFLGVVCFSSLSSSPSSPDKRGVPESYEMHVIRFNEHTQ